MTLDEKMEKPKLEKLIKKLEALDIREWKYNNDDVLTAEVCGMKIKIDGYFTRLSVENLESNIQLEDREEFKGKEYKDLKRAVENLYKKTYKSLLEYENKQLTEKLDTFLSD